MILRMMVMIIGIDTGLYQDHDNEWEDVGRMDGCTCMIVMMIMAAFVMMVTCMIMAALTWVHVVLSSHCAVQL